MIYESLYQNMCCSSVIRYSTALRGQTRILSTSHWNQSLIQCTNFTSGCFIKTTLNKAPILCMLNCQNRHRSFAGVLALNTHHTHTLTQAANSIGSRSISLDSKRFSNESKDSSELTRKDKLKRAVKEYGSTVIIFHVTISLASLGICYLIVSSGLDVASILSSLGISGSIATNAGTFVTAYAFHKVFAPVRISITLGATPFIVRYLRRIGFLKVPKKS